VAVLVSSKMSGTIPSALGAKEQLPDVPIRVVDSFGVAMSLRYCVEAAARAAQAGKSLDEIVAAAEAMRHRVHFLFAVDTLEYLHRGGRIGGAKALFGTALSIKPLLHFENGQIEPLMQVRTKRKAIATMLDEAEKRLAGGKMVEVAVLENLYRAANWKIENPSQGHTKENSNRIRFNVTVPSEGESVIRYTAHYSW
jgi:DegV family protein with EDD domain